MLSFYLLVVFSVGCEKTGLVQLDLATNEWLETENCGSGIDV